MELIVLSAENLNRIGIIDDAISVIWNKKYFSVGDFELETILTPYYISLLKKNNFIVRNGLTEIVIIETVTLSKDEEGKAIIKVKGSFAENLLSRRVVWGETLVNGSLLPQLRGLIDANALNPVDESGNALPDRVLISKVEKTAILGSSIDRPEGATMELQSISGNLVINQNGGGVGEVMQLKTPFVCDWGIKTQLITDTDIHYFGDLLKNPYTNVIDEIVIKGNEFIKKRRNYLLADFKTYLNSYLIKLKGKGSGRLSLGGGRVYSESLGSIYLQDNEEKLDVYLKFSNGVETRLFSDILDVRESGDNKDDVYITAGVYKDKFAVVLRNIPLVEKVDTELFPPEYDDDGYDISNYGLWHYYLSSVSFVAKKLPDNAKLLMEQQEIEEKTGITIADINKQSNSYVLSDGSKESVNSMLIESSVYNENVKSYIELEPETIENKATIYEIVKGSNLLEYVQNKLQLNGLAIKTEYDRTQNKIFFRFYSGVNRTAKQTAVKQIIFSRELDSLSSYELSESTTGKYNVVRCKGKRDDGDIWTEAGAAAGLTRLETYKDVQDITTFSEADYIRSLQSSGEIALNGYSVVIDVEIDASVYKYRQDYNVGDLVTVDITDINMRYNTRILEVCETEDEQGYKITLVLGE